MTILTFTLILLLGAYCAGLLGSLTGLGGGVVVIPLLTLCFGVDFHYAVGAALVASIATSSGSGAAYVKEGITNIRLGMLLEIATTIGAVCGAMVAVWLNNSFIAVLYGGVLVLTAVSQQRRRSEHKGVAGSEMARRLKLFGTYPLKDGTREAYELTNVGGGFGVMLLAGVLSGILGIGSGVLKVLAMDGLMKVPFRVSTTTSNFMMGVTACASAVVYIQRGNIVPGIAFPVLVGVLLGALTGARLLKVLDVSLLRKIFVFAILAVAANMIYMGLTGGFEHS
ncbi:sulfite exporter TauE/SafE family protein [Alloprevotella sp. OH1205_COT-284]|uniref:sulfite exporter TauE/SafE family protein n=1 Tax=Alloprevotella sp. OH1205_COT-284 TaxID=2491043 RepID=UPI000F5DC968|nr:sulfite exporter TauE/SafE family protein [Alloprevotella sp. OH1205_COT-284]RRD80038.1 sulfite exporter TauE/SafE family protein [Alloprevotella sp. OH1205_COT-284]